MTEKYRLGSIATGSGCRNKSFPRPLLDQDGRTVATVDCCEGPVLVGEMTADEAKKRFGRDVFESMEERDDDE